MAEYCSAINGNGLGASGTEAHPDRASSQAGADQKKTFFMKTQGLRGALPRAGVRARRPAGGLALAGLATKGRAPADSGSKSCCVRSFENLRAVRPAPSASAFARTVSLECAQLLRVSVANRPCMVLAVTS
ncbi:hypothetical protein D3C72_1758680 [compost metagenome]